MAVISFTIPDAVVTELNAIAVKNGFANAKAMMIAYLTATVKADRDNKAIKAVVLPTISDVIIS